MYDYLRPNGCNPCCDSNNNNNNNIVVPPVIINPKDDKKPCGFGKLHDFIYFTANPQDSTVNEVLISDNVNNPTVISQLTVTNIKKGDLIWLNGLFHIDNDKTEFITADVRIYENSIVSGQEIYKATIEIDEAYHDDLTQPIPVQDVKYFSEYTSSITYILVVSIVDTVDNDVFLNRPITFTASLIR
ncbi:MAG: hypothetical protein LKJ13_03630 [Clostridia bacterium]|jgi:hypothetical protein|nr:hypothetical protein [Clostridia bacterium]MCI1999785.1 hypothetical protein [Clostridia bacterium]MCI2014299.1 hypothetical protein [Clostridia bacterium]